MGRLVPNYASGLRIGSLNRKDRAQAARRVLAPPLARQRAHQERRQRGTTATKGSNAHWFRQDMLAMADLPMTGNTGGKCRASPYEPVGPSEAALMTNSWPGARHPTVGLRQSSVVGGRIEAPRLAEDRACGKPANVGPFDSGTPNSKSGLRRKSYGASTGWGLLSRKRAARLQCILPVRPSLSAALPSLCLPTAQLEGAEVSV